MIPRRLFILSDTLVLLGAFALAYVLAPITAGVLEASPAASILVWAGVPTVRVFDPILAFVWMLVLTIPAYVLVMTVLGGYRPLVVQSLTRVVLTSLAAPLAALSVLALVLWAVQGPSPSRLLWSLFALTAAAALIGYRLALRTYFRRRLASGAYARNVVLAGDPAGLQWLFTFWREEVQASGFRLYGYVQLPGEAPVEDAPEGAASLGPVDILGDLLIHRPIHEVIVIQPIGGGEWLRPMIEACDQMGVVLRIVPEALLFAEPRRLQMLYPFETLNLPAVVLQPPHYDSEALFIKRLMDIAISATLLVLLSPLFGLVALAIKLTTPNLPVLYEWKVVGKNGVEFTGYKFTTMVADADDQKSTLQDQNEMSGPVFKIKDDPRVTRLGRFLRKFSLNELPQLWSVLKGDMSLVGPRPAFRSELERYEFWHKRKLSIRPGITCLWQVRGRNQISSFDEWVRMDIEYIENWSLWLDCKTLARTAWVVVAGTGS